MNINTLGGRRFLVTLISGAGTWLLCLLGKIDGNVYSFVTVATIGAFIAGNTIQRRDQIKAGAPPA